MKRPKVTVTVYAGDGTELHSEQRAAFNAGIRASESAVRDIARRAGTLYHGAAPTREGDTYRRRWVSDAGDVALIVVRQDAD